MTRPSSTARRIPTSAFQPPRKCRSSPPQGTLDRFLLRTEQTGWAVLYLLTTAILLGAHSYDKTGTSAFFDVGCHAHAKSEHGEPWRYTIRGVSLAGMTSAALHARVFASMPPRESHGRLGPIGKTGIGITASSISSHSLTAVLVRLTAGHCSLDPRPTPQAENWVCF